MNTSNVFSAVVSTALEATVQVHREPATLVQTGLERYYDKPQFSDITLVTSAGKKIRCHQLLLSACSKKFASLFENGDLHYKELPVQGVSPEALELLIKYFYTGSCPITINNAVQMYDCCCKFDVPALASVCQQFINKLLHPMTVLLFLEHCMQLEKGSEALREGLLSFIRARFDDVIHSDSFPACSLPTLIKVMLDNKHRQPQVTLNKAVSKWVGAGAERVQVAHDIMAALEMHSAMHSDAPPTQEEPPNRLAARADARGLPAAAAAPAQLPLSSHPNTAPGAAAAGVHSAGPPTVAASSHPAPPAGTSSHTARSSEAMRSLQTLQLVGPDGKLISVTALALTSPMSTGHLDFGHTLMPTSRAQLSTMLPQSNSTDRSSPQLQQPPPQLPLQPPTQLPQQQATLVALPQMRGSGAASVSALPGAWQSGDHVIRLSHNAEAPARASNQQVITAGGSVLKTRNSGGTYYMLPMTAELSEPRKSQPTSPLAEVTMLSTAAANQSLGTSAGAAGPGQASSATAPSGAATGLQARYLPLAGSKRPNGALGQLPVQPGPKGQWTPRSMMPGRGIRSGPSSGEPALSVKVEAPSDVPGQSPRRIHKDANPQGSSRGQHRSAQGTPLCRVEDCRADLSNLKDYHKRFKICEAHLKASHIMKDGVAQRLCQQCNRFHPLSEFEGDKRSCRARLKQHNMRRRRQPSSGGADQEPGGARMARLRQKLRQTSTADLRAGYEQDQVAGAGASEQQEDEEAELEQQEQDGNDGMYNNIGDGSMSEGYSGEQDMDAQEERLSGSETPPSQQQDPPSNRRASSGSGAMARSPAEPSSTCGGRPSLAHLVAAGLGLQVTTSLANSQERRPSAGALSEGRAGQTAGSSPSQPRAGEGSMGRGQYELAHVGGQTMMVLPVSGAVMAGWSVQGAGLQGRISGSIQGHNSGDNTMSPYQEQQRQQQQQDIDQRPGWQRSVQVWEVGSEHVRGSQGPAQSGSAGEGRAE